MSLYSLLTRRNHRFILKLSLIISGSFELYRIHFQPKASHIKRIICKVEGTKKVCVFVCMCVFAYYQVKAERIRNLFHIMARLCYFHWPISLSAHPLWNTLSARLSVTERAGEVGKYRLVTFSGQWTNILIARFWLYRGLIRNCNGTSFTTQTLF